jgi:hypothetical protein
MMIEQVHNHIISELQQNARTDTVFILTAIFLNLISLGINSAISSNSRTQTNLFIVMFILVALVLVVNFIVIFGLLKGKQTRFKLISGLLKMYKDQNVDGYYDSTLLINYNIRYNLFIFAVIFTGAIAIATPFTIR